MVITGPIKRPTSHGLVLRTVERSTTLYLAPAVWRVRGTNDLNAVAGLNFHGKGVLQTVIRPTVVCERHDDDQGVPTSVSVVDIPQTFVWTNAGDLRHLHSTPMRSSRVLLVVETEVMPQNVPMLGNLMAMVFKPIATTEHVTVCSVSVDPHATIAQAFVSFDKSTLFRADVGMTLKKVMLVLEAEMDQGAPSLPEAPPQTMYQFLLEEWNVTPADAPPNAAKVPATTDAKAVTAKAPDSSKPSENAVPEQEDAPVANVNIVDSPEGMIIDVLSSESSQLEAENVVAAEAEEATTAAAIVQNDPQENDGSNLQQPEEVQQADSVQQTQTQTDDVHQVNEEVAQELNLVPDVSEKVLEELQGKIEEARAELSALKQNYELEAQEEERKQAEMLASTKRLQVQLAESEKSLASQQEQKETLLSLERQTVARIEKLEDHEREVAQMIIDRIEEETKYNDNLPKLRDEENVLRNTVDELQRRVAYLSAQTHAEEKRLRDAREAVAQVDVVPRGLEGEVDLITVRYRSVSKTIAVNRQTTFKDLFLAASSVFHELSDQDRNFLFMRNHIHFDSDVLVWGKLRDLGRVHATVDVVEF